MNPWVEEILIIFFMIAVVAVPGYLVDGDHLFGADVSTPADFDISLHTGIQYGLWVLDENGPEEIDISLSNGSYIVMEDTFRLMHPEGDYLPYHPGFTVREDGMYHLHIEPREKGRVRIGIRKDTGINPWRYARDLSGLIQTMQAGNPSSDN